jgi:spermidine synthase
MTGDELRTPEIDNGASIDAPIAGEATGEGAQGRARRIAVYASLLMVATAGLAYELALGAAESLLLGDPVVHFALIIGLYMTSLGAGAYASGWLKVDVEKRCLQVLLATALLGGCSGPVLLFVFVWQGPFKALLYLLTAAVGALVGLQLPLMMRILRERERFEDVVARSFAVDYAGALVGSLCFSLVLMPYVGLVRTTLVLGLVDAVGAIALAWVVRTEPKRARGQVSAAVAVAALLLALIVVAGRVERALEWAL